MEVADSVLDLIGNTPLVRLDRIGRDLRCHLLAKLEYLNPGGSVKDRPALAMIDAAEAEGLLAPGGTIVEPTSGNTGVGLAMVAAQRGYHCIFTMPDKIAEEKRQLLRAFGAEVVICPTAVRSRASRLVLLGGQPAHRGDPGSVPAQPVPQSRQPERPRGLHRSRDLASDGRTHHPFRRRRGHRWHDQRRRAVSEGAEAPASK